MSRFRNISYFDTNTRIHININSQEFTHLRNKTRLFEKVKYEQNRIKKYRSYTISKSVNHREIQILISFCSFNKCITRNPGNC